MLTHLSVNVPNRADPSLIRIARCRLPTMGACSRRHLLRCRCTVSRENHLSLSRDQFFILYTHYFLCYCICIAFLDCLGIWKTSTRCGVSGQISMISRRLAYCSIAEYLLVIPLMLSHPMTHLATILSAIHHQRETRPHNPKGACRHQNVPTPMPSYDLVKLEN